MIYYLTSGVFCYAKRSQQHWSVKEYIAEQNIDRVLVLYSPENFCTDSSVRIY